MKKMLLMVVIALALTTNTAFAGFFDNIGEGTLGNAPQGENPLAAYGVSINDFKNMDGMWMMTDPDVQPITSFSDRDKERGKWAIRYEFFYKKNDNVFVVRGQRRVDEDRRVFHAIYDPSTKMLYYSSAGNFLDNIAEEVKKIPGGNTEKRGEVLRSLAGNVPFALVVEKADKRSPIGGTVSPVDELVNIEYADKQLPWAYGLYTYYTLNLYSAKDDFHNIMMQIKSDTENLNCIEETKRIIQGLKSEKFKNCIELYEIANMVAKSAGSKELMIDMSSHPLVHKQISQWLHDAGTKKLGSFLSDFFSGLPYKVKGKNIQDAQFGLAMKLREPDSLKALSEKIKKPSYLE